MLYYWALNGTRCTDGRRKEPGYGIISSWLWFSFLVLASVLPSFPLAPGLTETMAEMMMIMMMVITTVNRSFMDNWAFF